MMWKLVRKLLFPKSRLIARARTGDPLSIGLMVIYTVYKMMKKRSNSSGYKTKLLPGQTITVRNIVTGGKRSKRK